MKNFKKLTALIMMLGLSMAFAMTVQAIEGPGADPEIPEISGPAADSFEPEDEEIAGPPADPLEIEVVTTTTLIVEGPPADPFEPEDEETATTTDDGPPADQFEPEDEVVFENTYELCHDGIDNDDDTLTDMADSDCADFEDAPETPEEPVTSTSRSGGGGSSRNREVLGASTDDGEVLGASTDGSCLFTDYMKIGQDNNVLQVMLLQAFLNVHMNANLPITGFFGPLTEQAVKDFQLKHANTVLKPWVNLGLHPSVNVGTGYFYKTTKYMANTILCSDKEIEFPELN